MNRSIHDEAQAEFLAALDHYAAISTDLGERFYVEIERLMTEICAAPKRFRKYDPPARRHLARAFPFAVVYIENDEPRCDHSGHAAPSGARLLETTPRLVLNCGYKR